MPAELKLLGNFPYLDHYLELANIERELTHIKSKSKLMFVGGGPMPLTPIALVLIEIILKAGLGKEFEECLNLKKGDEKRAAVSTLLEKLDTSSLDPDYHIISVEKDTIAADRSRELLKALHLDHAITVQNLAGQDIKVEPGFKTFFIASMVVGKEEVMRNIMRQIPQGEEVLFLVRSVEQSNLRELLYEPIEEMLEEIERKYPALQKHNSYTPPPGSALINSVHVYKFKNLATPVLD
jgi:hypothetical protein